MHGMYEQKTVAGSIDLKRPVVVRALRRSDVRKKILKHLFDISPSGSYVSDLAYHAQTTPTNVIGALRGLNKRYRREESLISLEIVEEIKSEKNLRVYRITDFGKEMMQTLNQRK